MTDHRRLDETLPHVGPADRARLDDAERHLLAGRLKTLSGADLVDRVRQDQRDYWERGDRVLIEAYLSLSSVAQAGDEVALDLIYSELILRESFGEARALETLLGRFPQYESQLRELHTLDRAFGLDQLAEGPELTTPPVEPAPPAGGQRFLGRYAVLDVLAEGGQAVVYRAVHPNLSKEVVIKWSKQPLASAADRDRLVTEGRLLAQLDHPHLARILDLDFHAGRPFLVMEYVAGQNLEQYFGRSRLTPRQSARLVAQIARALAVVHRRGVLHQDLKPKNVVIDEHGQPRLIDFGLARLKTAFAEDTPEPGSISGTVAYLAPEQARANLDAIGPPTDVFGLGGVLYYLLAGHAPYHGLSFNEAIERAGQGSWDRLALDRPGVPRRLRAICARAMASEPGDRFPDAEALARDLERFANRPRVLAATGAVLVAALALLGLVWLLASPGKAPAPNVVRPAMLAQPTSLHVQTWRNELGPFELVNAVPLRTGEEIAVKAELPPGVSAVLVHFSEGRLTRLAAADASPLRFPAQAGLRAMLEGEPGTEFLLLCGKAKGSVDLEELRWLLGPEPLPQLPPDAVLRLDEQGVRVVQKPRGSFGAPMGQPSPQDRAVQRLEGLRSQLQGRFDVFAGIVFAHRAPEDE